jgi:hypothetical protein
MILLLYSFRCKPAGENYPPHFSHYTLITRLLDTFEFLLLLHRTQINPNIYSRNTQNFNLKKEKGGYCPHRFSQCLRKTVLGFT